MEKVSSWHVGIAAEAFAAAQFTRFGVDVSVQYGANQPEYDLIATRGDPFIISWIYPCVQCPFLRRGNGEP